MPRKPLCDLKLDEVPWQGGTWQNAYPYMSRWTFDVSDKNNPDLVYNASESRIFGNLIVSDVRSIGYIDQSVYRFSEFSDNKIFMLNAMKRIFVDPEKGDYRLKEKSAVYSRLPDFKPIPLEEVGRKN